MTQRWWGLGVLPAVAVFLGGPRAATAQENSLQGQVSTSAGITDNANLAPSNPEPGQEGAVGDGFSSVSPGVFYVRRGKRAIHILSYRFDAQLFFQNPEANSYTNQLNWAGLFLLSRRARLGFVAGAAQGETNNFRVASADPTVEATPAGGVTFVTANVGQNFGLELSRLWRLGQQARFQSYFPISGESQPNAYDANLVVRADRTWRRNAIGILFGADYFITQESLDADGNVVAEGQQQLVAGPQVVWRRDAGAFWSFELGAGLQAITRTDAFDATGIVYQPTAVASVRYTRRRGSILAAYTHATAPNLQVGDVFVNDSVGLEANYPLLQERRVFLRGGVGAQRTRQVNVVDSSVGGNSFVYLADAAIAWDALDNVALSLRYQYRRQDAAEMSSLEDFTANTVLLSISGRYPGTAPPGDLLRQPSRVDGSDAEDPFGKVNRDGQKPRSR